MDILFSRKCWTAEEYHNENLPLDIILQLILPAFPRDWLFVSLQCQAAAFPLLLTDPRVDIEKAKSGSPPLVEACAHGYLRVVKLLTQNVRVNLATVVQPAIEASIRSGHIHVFDYLYNIIAPNIRELDPFFITKLISLSIKGGHELMFIRTMNIAFSLSIIGPQFATSLAEEAIEAGHYHITKLLLKDCHLTNEMLCTATWRGDCRMLNLLL
jgi:hypothetical protein